MAISAMFMALFVTIAAFVAGMFVLDVGMIACLIMALAVGSFTMTAVVLVSVLIALHDLEDASQSEQFKNLSS